MKKQYFISSVLATAITVFVFSSFSNGLAALNGSNQSGNFAAEGSCAGTNCHAANNPNLILTYKVYKTSDPSMLPVTSYEPGAVYQIKFQGFYINGLDDFGYQISIVDKMGSSQGLVLYPGNVQKVYVNGVDVFEQRAPIAGRPFDYIDSLQWVAPGAGKGTIKINIALLASNNNGSPLGDIANAVQIPLTEGNPNAVKEISQEHGIFLYPNPAQNFITLHYTASVKNEAFYIIDISGKLMMSGKVEPPLHSIDISGLPAGQYFINLAHEGQKISKAFIKQ